MWADFTYLDLVGVIGSLMICAAYWAVSAGRVAADNFKFQSANLVGSILLLISLYYRPNPGAIVIEVLWFVIAVAALYRILRR